jgi:pilus assembly protein CpaF
MKSENLFFTPETEGKDFSSVLADVQGYIFRQLQRPDYRDIADAKAQMKRYITKYIQDRRIAVAA